LARLKEIEHQAIDHEPMLQTSEQVLALKGQGAAELDRYVNQLRDLAPHQLDTFRHQSLVTSDKVLGAALALRVGAMNPKDRPFNVVEFADALVGLEFTANQKAIARIKLATKKAVHADLAFSRGRSNLMSNIAIGIAERELQQ
jgi:hypothetical protein